jgi:AcrR family transcriptional regulator
MAKKIKPETDISTEEKIKEAARTVFTQKGFAATRTRDIAEAAGINLALLNYYFRSKEKLFDIVMLENIQKFLLAMKGVFNNESMSLVEKVTALIDNYISLLIKNPDLPLFILSEIKANPEKLAANMGIREVLLQSDFFRQLQAAGHHQINPFHFIMNIIGLAVFPFIANPLLKVIGGFGQADFDNLMEERKRMIPRWIDAMLKV